MKAKSMKMLAVWGGIAFLTVILGYGAAHAFARTPKKASTPAAKTTPAPKAASAKQAAVKKPTPYCNDEGAILTGSLAKACKCGKGTVGALLCGSYHPKGKSKK